MSPLVNNVPPRACAFKVVCGQGGLAFLVAKLRALQLAAAGTCMDLTTAARPTIGGEIQLARIRFNSLTTVGYLLEVFIRLWIPSMVRIFTSAWS